MTMSRTGASELEPLVNQFEHLSEKRRAPEALEKLQKIASLVKPIMRQRNWRVGTLAEFYPAEGNLLGLNINKGQKICLRLRYPGDDTQFLPIENIVDTMLHELAHNVHGPHDQHFHALWDKLRDEHEALLRKGYTGEGFLGRGQRLGGQRIPMAEARRVARAAAERRKVLTAGSGQKLGGAGIMRGQNAREVIARAAEKRLKIERGCVSATEKGWQIARDEEMKKEKVTTTTAEKEDENEARIMQAYIDLIQEEESQQFGKDYIPPSESNPAGSKGVGSPPGIRTSIFPPTSPNTLLQQQKQIEKNLRNNREREYEPQPEQPKQKSQPQKQLKSRPTTPPPQPSIPIRNPSPPALETWTCEICTLVNPLQYLICDACSTERPEIYSSLTSPSPPRPTTNRSTSNTNSRPQPYSSSSNSTAKSRERDIPNALKPRLNATDSLARINQQQSSKVKDKPVGWMCNGCSNFMESQWWTCSVCGRMKTSS